MQWGYSKHCLYVWIGAGLQEQLDHAEVAFEGHPAQGCLAMVVAPVDFRTVLKQHADRLFMTVVSRRNQK